MTKTDIVIVIGFIAWLIVGYYLGRQSPKPLPPKRRHRRTPQEVAEARQAEALTKAKSVMPIKPVDGTPLWDYMKERHRTHIMRLQNPIADPLTWTKDPIIQKYSFCNVFRELDRTTVWIDQHIRQPFADHPNLWFLLCLARQINWAPTLDQLLKEAGLPEWHPDRVLEILRERHAQGIKTYTGAYIIAADGGKHATYEDKPPFTVHKVLDPLWHANPVDQLTNTSIQQATECLTQFHGFGAFLAYEVATDLRHTRYLREAPDVMTWANPGPGAKRGLNRLVGRTLGATLRTERAIAEMRQLLADSASHLPGWVHAGATDFSGAQTAPVLELRDIEHSLCDLDKYLRVVNGEGAPRSLFTPTRD